MEDSSHHGFLRVVFIQQILPSRGIEYWSTQPELHTIASPNSPVRGVTSRARVMPSVWINIQHLPPHQPVASRAEPELCLPCWVKRVTVVMTKRQNLCLGFEPSTASLYRLSFTTEPHQQSDSSEDVYHYVC